MPDYLTTEGGMDSTERLRETAIRELEHLLRSAAELRSSVRTGEVGYRKALAALKKGTEVSDVLREVHAGTTRQALTEMLTSFNLVRHRSRLALFAAGLAEGMTIGELGRVWGFSRQLASQCAREARGHLGVAPATSKDSGA